MLASAVDWYILCLFFYNLPAYLDYSCSDFLFIVHLFVKKNVVVCFVNVFREGSLNALIPYWDIFHEHVCIYLVYGRFARTPGYWCTHDLSVRYFFVFYLYHVSDHKRLALKIRNAKDRWDLLTSFMQARSFGYPTGSLNETQLKRAFSDHTKKPWWLFRMFNSHPAWYLRPSKI